LSSSLKIISKRRGGVHGLGVNALFLKVLLPLELLELLRVRDAQRVSGRVLRHEARARRQLALLCAQLPSRLLDGRLLLAQRLNRRSRGRALRRRCRVAPLGAAARTPLLPRPPRPRAKRAVAARLPSNAAPRKGRILELVRRNAAAAAAAHWVRRRLVVYALATSVALCAQRCAVAERRRADRVHTLSH